MRAVGLKVLKNKLSEYVRLVATGETVLVTDRDRVVAELGPPREGRSPLLADAVLAEAVRKGWMTPARFRLTGSTGPRSSSQVRASADATLPGSSRPMIYLDTSVALAQLLAEDRIPPVDAMAGGVSFESPASNMKSGRESTRSS